MATMNTSEGKAAPAAEAARPQQAKTFAGELPGTFEEVARQVESAPARPVSWRQRLARAVAHLPRVAALLRPLTGPPPASVSIGQMAFDGFRGGDFGTKQERERRYGEVYSLQESDNAFLIRVEFPRRVPLSAAKDELGLPDEMPPYGYDLSLQNGYFVVKGRVEDPNLRKLAAVSPAFPPNFTTHIKLPASVTGFRHRFVGRNLEVVLLKQ